MTGRGLIVSSRLEFRKLLKDIMSECFSNIEVRSAADVRIGMSRLVEDRYEIVIVDDETASAFFDEFGGDIHNLQESKYIRLRSGGRAGMRTRMTPFSHIDLTVESTREVVQVREALINAMKEYLSNSRKDAFSKSPVSVQSQPPPQTAVSSAVRSSVLFRTNPEIIIPEIVVIGSSTGGPDALEKFFRSLDTRIVVPVVIVQHMPAGFTKGLAERIEKVSGQKSVELEHDMVLEAGRVHICPGDFHVRLKKAGDLTICKLDKGPLINSVRPAVDPMFETAAGIYGSKVMSIVFTGMGEDGAAGAQKVKEAGGCVAIQDEASCVVWGMPGAVAKLGVQDVVATPEMLAGIVSRQMIRRGGTPRRSA